MFTTIFKGTAFEFRFRILIHMVIYALGCFAPWMYLQVVEWPAIWDQRVWAAAPYIAMKLGWANFEAVSIGVTAVALLCAVVGAVFRVWGSAYMGTSVVQDSAMHAGGGAVVADGPYRHVRNPLYIGMIFFTLALTLVMPLNGAVFAVVAMVVFDLRLIGGEEAFLSAKLGGPYGEYKKQVPRLVPSLLPRVAGSGVRAKWGQALLGEIFFIAVPVGYAVLGWHYDSQLLGRYLIVAFGGALVVRAFVRTEVGAAV
jgi:protein-S-isoprenylcysteine O-methyltransferase Ste14